MVVQDQGHRLHYFTHKGEYKNSFFVGVSTNPRAFIDIYTLISLKSNPEKKTKTEILEIYDIKTQKKYRLAELKAEGALEGSSGSGKGDVSVSVMDPETTAQLLLSYNNKKLIIGKTDKYTIIKLDLSGKELLTFSINGRKAKPITAEYKKNFTLRLKEIPESVKKQIAANIPDNSTYFNDIQVDEKGLIYVFITDVSTKKARALDIFSPAGKYLYKSVLTMPEGYIIAGDIKFHGSNLYIVLEDDEGERELVKFKIKTPQL
ncbi:MAG: hypothetical protein GY757_60780 [bacterium]|nr:hypothetical protein [bacterium]